jgi:hypothetical protein
MVAAPTSGSIQTPARQTDTDRDVCLCPSIVQDISSGLTLLAAAGQLVTINVATTG